MNFGLYDSGAYEDPAFDLPCKCVVVGNSPWTTRTNAHTNTVAPHTHTRQTQDKHTHIAIYPSLLDDPANVTSFSVINIPQNLTKQKSHNMKLTACLRHLNGELKRKQRRQSYSRNAREMGKRAKEPTSKPTRTHQLQQPPSTGAQQ